MSSDNATDVAKALAAFGAPSIRYHSFSQSQVKPSSVVVPRRETSVRPASDAELFAADPLVGQPSAYGDDAPDRRVASHHADAVLIRQNEPEAAPEPHLSPLPVEPAVMPNPVASPTPAFRGLNEPARSPLRYAPVPPPRPVGPAIPAPSSQIPRGVVLNAADGAPPNPSMGFRPMPAPLAAPDAPTTTAEDLRIRPPPVMPGLSARGLPAATLGSSQRPAGPQTLESLQDIFAFLAAAPAASAPRTFG